MGNSASSSARGQHDDTVDYGFLEPQGVYTGQPDWNHSIVSQLIIDRKLAPFYRPLEDYNDDWDDEHILAARKELPDIDPASTDAVQRVDQPRPHPARRPPSLRDPGISQEAAVYRGAVECPICFLYYPPNINRSRCCDQAICTECFVQIKRSEPTVTHLVSEPAACPYCVQDNFGVTYTPPAWRAGIGSDNFNNVPHPSPPKPSSHQSEESVHARRKSLNHDNHNVVTVDQIRPDWEAKLAAVRAAVARRANRRIIMRQVGDRLIPVGVTSGRVHALSEGVITGEQGETAEVSGEGRSSRRSRRRAAQQQELNHLLGSMGLGGQDLEELMVMEAMRLSLLDHEEQQRREAQKKDGNAERQSPSDNSESNSMSSSPKPDLPPIPSSPPDLSPRLSSSSDIPLSSSPSVSGALSTSPRSHHHTPSVSSPLVSSDTVSVENTSNPVKESTTSAEPSQPGPSTEVHTTETAGNSVDTPLAVETANADLPNGHPPNLPYSLPPPSSINIKPNFSAQRQDSSWSSVFETSNELARSSSTYDVLPSSPESSITHLPLLRPTPSVDSAEERRSTT